MSGGTTLTFLKAFEHHWRKRTKQNQDFTLLFKSLWSVGLFNVFERMSCCLYVDINHRLTLKNCSLSLFLVSSISWFLIIVSGLCVSDRHQHIRESRRINMRVCISVCVCCVDVLWHRLQVEGTQEGCVLYLYCCGSASGGVGAGGFTAAAPMTRALTCTVTPSWRWPTGRRPDGSTVTLIHGDWRALDGTEKWV